jgi:ABC-type glycerol-3-phosphate transport system permease component
LIATTVTLLTLAFGSLSAYTVTRLRLRWVMWLTNLSVFARFVPIIVVMIPLYVTFRQLGLLNSVWGVIIALTGFLLPYGVVILALFRRRTTRARGGRAHRRLLALWRLSARHRAAVDPGTGVVRWIFFIVAWNDLLIPLILNNRAEFMTLPVVIASLVSDLFVFHNLMMAICLIALAPSVILVLLLRRFVVEGLSGGAMKG